MDAETLVDLARNCEVAYYDIDSIRSNAANWDHMYSAAQVDGSIQRIRRCVRDANQLLDFLESVHI